MNLVVRVAAGLALLRVADCTKCAALLRDERANARRWGLFFPNCASPAYTCADLFHQPHLQQTGLRPWRSITRGTYFRGGYVGLPSSERAALQSVLSSTAEDLRDRS